jgi:hypothetical protein
VRRILYLGTVLIAISAPAHSDGIRLPDLKAGQINGIIAVMFWPANNTDGGNVDTLLPADDCQVVLAPWTDFAAERRYRCGIWFQPPEGRYQAWLEKGGDRITPTSATFNYAPASFQGRGQGVVMPLHPGGQVALAEDIPLPPGAELTLINFDSCCAPPKLGNPFARRAIASTPSLRSGLPVPTGKVFAGIFDRKTREAIAIARPVRVEAGKVATVAPRPPAVDTADVFVSLGRPDVRASRDVDVVELTLDGKKPEALFDGSDRIYAAWFGVKGGTAQLSVASKALRLSTRTLTLTSGRVVTVREELQKLPSVAVSLVTPSPAAFEGETLRVEVLHPSSAEPFRGTPIIPGEEVLLDSLPEALLDIVLSVGPWRFRERVDLTSGLSEKVRFDLQPIVISGEVFYGRERAVNAEVAFEADAGLVRVQTDDAGRYQTTFWHGGDAWTVHVSVPGRHGPPFVDGFVQINETRTLDIHVPRTEYEVRVLDSESGRGIAGADVSASNVFTHGNEGEMTLVQRATTDDDGHAYLAPLRPGKLAIRVRAEGYRESERIDGGTVRDIDSRGKHEVRLQPVGETVQVLLRMPDGRPVGAAELWAVRATHGIQRPLWRGQSNGDGVASVPRNVDGATLLIRSPITASAVRPFRADFSDPQIVLQPPAPAIQATAEPRTRIALWIDGVRVTGPAVTFLAWSSEASDAEGNWSAKNLPAQPLRLLAWQRASEQEIVAGLRDANAITIDYPWPSIVTLRPYE